MPRRGEVWWADLDPVVGHELGRKIRPVLIVSIDAMNQGPAEKVIVVPSTTQSRGTASEVPLVVRTAGGPRASYLCCEDVRSISIQRLQGQFGRGTVPPNVMTSVEHVLRILLAL